MPVRNLPTEYALSTRRPAFKTAKRTGFSGGFIQMGPSRATRVPGWRRFAQHAGIPAGLAYRCWCGSRVFRPQSDRACRFRPTKGQTPADGQVRERAPAPDTVLIQLGKTFAGVLARPGPRQASRVTSSSGPAGRQADPPVSSRVQPWSAAEDSSRDKHSFLHPTAAVTV